jgi:hypothetical protein
MSADGHFAWDVPWQGLKSVRKAAFRAGKIGSGPERRGLNSLRNKSGHGKDRQGLKPGFFGIVYGPTKPKRSIAKPYQPIQIVNTPESSETMLNTALTALAKQTGH